MSPRTPPIRPAGVFLVTPGVANAPQRMADSCGVIMERKRLPHEDDGLMLFCEQCNRKLYEEYFFLNDIEKDFPPVFEHFYASREHRTCKQCGHLNPAPSKYEFPDT